MRSTVRHTLTVAAGVGALLVAAAGVASAATGDDPDSSHHPDGTGSGLRGGPTPTYVLSGAPPAPLSDPTAGEGTVLPPVYNTLGGATG